MRDHGQATPGTENVADCLVPELVFNKWYSPLRADPGVPQGARD